MFLDAEKIDKLVDPAKLVDDIARVLTGGAEAPLRASLEHRGSWLGAMPAGGLGYFAVKIVGVYPANPIRNLPLVRGVLLLFDAETGDLLLEADAAPATGWRTAAASALALRLMGFRGGGTLGIIGAGVQGEYHARVLDTVYGFDEFLVYSKTWAKAEEMAKRHGGRAVELEELLRRSDVVVAATSSREPVVRGELLQEGTMVVSVGAPKPVRELDAETVKRAGCILVDTREGVLVETEDVEGAEELVELAEALKGRECRFGELRVYKSVGTALFDLAIALHLYERLQASP